jgi:hypothetical protein
MTSRDQEPGADHAGTPAGQPSSSSAIDWMLDELFVATLELAACAAASDATVRGRITRAIDRIDQVIPELRRSALARTAETDGTAPSSPTTRHLNSVSPPRGRPGRPS